MAQAKSAKIQTDRLVAEALRKELSLEKDLDTLRNQAAQFPEVRAQLAEAKAEVDRLKGQEVELEKVRRQLAEMEDYKAQLA